MAKKKGEEVKMVSVLTEDTAPSSVGISLAEELKSGDEMKVDEQSVILHINKGHITVDMTGYWNGRLLSAAMHAIEKKYDEVRKHAAVWAMKQSQQIELEKV